MNSNKKIVNEEETEASQETEIPDSNSAANSAAASAAASAADTAPEETSVEVPGKVDQDDSLGYYKQRKIDIHSDGNPMFQVDDEDYKHFINRKAGSHWKTSSDKLKDWLKTGKEKVFWVVNKENPDKKYLYVSPKRKQKKE